jgi:hypothetical protein
MKKTMLFVVLIIATCSSLAAAGEIDGLWWSPVYGDSAFFMVRENGGTVLVAAFNLAEYGESYGFDALLGTKTGNTARLYDYIYSFVEMDVSVTFTSASSGIVSVNKCVPKAYNVHCVFPSGVSFNIVKYF